MQIYYELRSVCLENTTCIVNCFRRRAIIIHRNISKCQIVVKNIMSSEIVSIYCYIMLTTNKDLPTLRNYIYIYTYTVCIYDLRYRY